MTLAPAEQFSINAPDSGGATCLRFAIRGMTCASCVAHIEKATAALPGVRSVSVNLTLERADVLAPAALAERIVAAIADEGYEARLVTDADRAAAAQDESETAAPRDLFLSAALTLPVLVIEMGAHLVPAFHHWQMEHLGTLAPRLIAMALTAAILAGPGRRFFLVGIPALWRFRPEMNTLVALGAGAAFLYSSLATLAPGLFPSGADQVYFESAAVIVTLILLGRHIEALSRRRAGASVRELMALQPKVAIRIRDGVEVETPVQELCVGDVLLVRPGAAIPVDGVVTGGRSHVDESMLTGEAMPIAKEIGASIAGGAINGIGALTMKATAVGDATLLSGIIRLVETAQATKLPVQRQIDAITARFVPAVMLVSALTFALWFWLGPAPALPHALVAAVSVLIIACPCAMGLATPTSVAVATGRAAELGVLFRSGEALERMGQVKLIAFDKTGTLTRGKPVVSDVVALPGHDVDMVLSAAAAVERWSEHPLARAVVEAMEKRGPLPEKARGFLANVGMGVRGEVAGQRVLVGSPGWLLQHGVDDSALHPHILRHAAAGRTVFLISMGDKAAGLIAIEDEVRPESAEVVAALKAAGIAVAMISGDQKATAEAVAARLGITEVHAGVLPGGKVAVLAELSRRAGPTAFVGDGVNDAPVLAAADVGIAVGHGSAVAVETADVVLVGDDLSALVRGLGLSRAAMRNIRENLVWAFGYNVALVPVAAGALYPFFGILLSPMLAAGAMAASSLFVVGNALRLRRFAAARSA